MCILIYLLGDFIRESDHRDDGNDQQKQQQDEEGEKSQGQMSFMVALHIAIKKPNL